MSDQDAFERILASVYDAMLDDARWPAASALIDEACGLTGNDLMVGEGPKDDVRARFVGGYCRGQRREDLEREYLEDYHPTDERVPRFRQLPDGRLVHVKVLYTAEELKTSPTYNEILPRAGHQDSLNVRLDGPDGSHITWGLGDPVDSDGWGSSRITMVTGLLPHIRQLAVATQEVLGRLEARRPGGGGAGPRARRGPPVADRGPQCRRRVAPTAAGRGRPAVGHTRCRAGRYRRPDGRAGSSSCRPAAGPQARIHRRTRRRLIRTAKLVSLHFMASAPSAPAERHGRRAVRPFEVTPELVADPGWN